MRLRIAFTCFVSVLLIGCAEANPHNETHEQTRAIMGQVFDAMRTLLPASVDLEGFSAEANRPKLERAFDQLAAQTDALEEHVGGQELRYSYLARNVASDASAANRAFAEGRYERSAFLLGQISENCIVCHSLLPSPGDSPLAEEFMTPEALAGVPLERRGGRVGVKRRFDDALTTLEELFASRESAVLMLGPLTDYLVVNIRVKGDVERPARTLRRFLGRRDLWEQYRANVEQWIEQLGEIGPALRVEPSLAGGRTLFQTGLQESAVPGSRAGLVDLIAASAILERFSIATEQRGPQLAEAYFLLGVIEARIGRNYWVSEAPFFLETSIRMAPHEPFARDAYALLQRELLMEYEGADEEELPAEDKRKLAELEALLKR